MADRVLNSKGQATLETAIVFFLIVALFGGIIKIWLWENRQIVERQLRYNATRASAGTAVDNYKLQWPVYAPPDLKEEDVIINNSSFGR